MQWDYLNLGYLDALQHLAELQREGKIKLLGLTNFDTGASFPRLLSVQLLC